MSCQTTITARNQKHIFFLRLLHRFDASYEILGVSAIDVSAMFFFFHIQWSQFALSCASQSADIMAIQACACETAE